MTNCVHCGVYTSNPKFCSKSCSASFNNKGIRRHGNAPNRCRMCNTLTSSCKQIFCSFECSAKSRMTTIEEKRSRNAARQSLYRQKQYRNIDPSANPALILEVYKNCPEGYEVDHIIPVSKGGLHHQDNLQYLSIKDNRKKGNRLVEGAGLAPANQSVMS